MSNSVRVALWKSPQLVASLLRATVLATLGFPASSFAQGSLTQTGYVYDSDLHRIDSEISSGCRNRFREFPSFRPGFSLSIAANNATPLSRSEYDRLYREWSKLPECQGSTAVAGAQPFVGLNIGGAFQSTNFSVDPPFSTNGSGVIGGGFGGVLFPLANTNVQLGFRVGGEGSNITGDIRMPAASPTFTYKVQTNWIVYQEAALKIGEILEVDPRARGAFSREGGGLFALFAAGVAESGTSVKGTSGMFSVTDNAVRSGMTFSAGAGIPLFMLANGVGIDGLIQYRGILWSSTANIPGRVDIGSFTNELTAGLMVRFGAPPPP
jgi:hypothetical protein